MLRGSWPPGWYSKWGPPGSQGEALGIGEMAPWLRAPTVLAENPGSIFITYTMAHNHLQLQLQGTWCPLLTSEGTRQAHPCACRWNIQTQLKIKKIKKNKSEWGPVSKASQRRRRRRKEKGKGREKRRGREETKKGNWKSFVSGHNASPPYTSIDIYLSAHWHNLFYLLYFQRSYW